MCVRFYVPEGDLLVEYLGEDEASDEEEDFCGFNDVEAAAADRSRFCRVWTRRKLPLRHKSKKYDSIFILIDKDRPAITSVIAYYCSFESGARDHNPRPIQTYPII